MTKPIERAISGAPRLEALQSTSANSIALVVAQFSFGTDVKEIRALDRAEHPGGGPARRPSNPTVAALNINPSPVIIASIAATTPDGLSEAARIAQDRDPAGPPRHRGRRQRRRQRRRRAAGRRSRSTRRSSPRRTSSQAQVVGVLTANNITIPSGQVQGDGTKIPVSTIGVIGSVDEIRDMVVGVAAPARPSRRRSPPPRRSRTPRRPAGCLRAAVDQPGRAARPHADHDRRPRHGRDRRASPTTGYARRRAEEAASPSLSLSVTKTSTANTVQVADAVTAKLAELGAQHADVVTVTVVSDLSSFIKESRDGLLREGGTGRAVRGPDDLPVPLQPALDAGRGRQHPAVACSRRS